MKANQSRKMSKKITGQGMSEYMVIVGLLAVAGIAVMGLMGNVVRENVSGFANELAGQDGSAQETNAGADATTSTGHTEKSLSNYSGGANALGTASGG